MATAAIYTRISKDDADMGLGVQRQERICRDLAKQLGLTVTEVLTDNDLSAYGAKKRPEFERLVVMLQNREVGAVVTYHADRLYRRAADLERLVRIVEASGAQVHTVAAGDIDLSTASGRMIARMLGAAAQHESERMSERLRAKMDELAAAGKHPGGRPPFGYASGYLVEPREAEIVRLIAARVLDGRSLLSIARELDALGHRTREGRPWHNSTVRTVVINPAVAGLRVHRREIAGPGNWEPVLDRPTWERMRAMLADPHRKRRRPAQKYLLTGLVEGCEGDRMIGRPDHGAGGATDRRTYATRAPAKRALSIDADALEADVIEMVLHALDTSSFPATSTDHDGAGEAIAGLESELDQLAALRGKGVISMSEWLAARPAIQERLDTAKKAASGNGTRKPAEITRLLAKQGAVRKAWPTLDFATRRAVLEAIVEKVVIGPATRARWTSLEERLDHEQGFGIVWRA